MKVCCWEWAWRFQKFAPGRHPEACPQRGHPQREPGREMGEEEKRSGLSTVWRGRLETWGLRGIPDVVSSWPCHLGPW